MSSETIVRNSINDLYGEESYEFVNCLQMSEDEILVNSDKFEDVVKNHINSVFHNSDSWEIKSLGEGLLWLNADAPLNLNEELKNKIVILDFFTYCCINCEHVLPIIQHVEQKYENNPELVVIGIHSPKHPNEKDNNSVRNALKRNKIWHPVINDYDNKLWNALDINCWPTVLVIGPDNKVLFSLIGETAIKKLEFLCQITLKFFANIGIALNKTKLPTLSAEALEEKRVLLYPSGISCSKESDNPTILVSDTGHNRLLLMTSDGEVLDIIGNGSKGLANGSFCSSSFNSPHGSAWLGENFALVADTGNNCIRLIDMMEKKVSTFETKENCKNLLPFTSNRYENCNNEFKSPWDVCIIPGDEGYDTAYVTAAGSHQIWAFHLCGSFLTRQFLHPKCFPYAGNGKEECRNNHYKEKAGFAQPSGICYSPEFNSFYIVDSESSSLRSLSCTSGSVQTVVGGDKNPTELFCFGDEDGEGFNVKLQHPLSLCTFNDSKLLLTDSYNHKIKLVDIRTKKCSTFAGSGVKGNLCHASKFEAEFDEPSGICFFNNTVLVADTNNHTVKMIDLKEEKVKHLNISLPNTSCIDGIKRKPRVITQHLTAKLKPKGEISFIFILKQPGVTLTEGAPQMWTVSFEGTWDWSISCLSSSIVNTSPKPSLRLKSIHEESDQCSLTVDLSFSACDDSKKTCIQKCEVVKVDVVLSESGSENFDALFYF